MFTPGERVRVNGADGQIFSVAQEVYTGIIEHVCVLFDDGKLLEIAGDDLDVIDAEE